MRYPAGIHDLCANPELPFLTLPKLQRRSMLRPRNVFILGSNIGPISIQTSMKHTFNFFAAYVHGSDVIEDNPQNNIPELKPFGTPDSLSFTLKNPSMKLYSYGKYCLTVFIKEYLPKGTTIWIETSRLPINVDMLNLLPQPDKPFLSETIDFTINHDTSVDSSWIKCYKSDVLFKNLIHDDVSTKIWVTLPEQLQ